MMDTCRGQFFKEADHKARCNALANQILPEWIQIVVLGDKILIKEKCKMAGFEINKKIKEHYMGDVAQSDCEGTSQSC